MKTSILATTTNSLLGAGMDDILAISAVAMKFLQLIISLIFIGHLFGCFWNYTSSNFVSAEDEANGFVWYKNPLVDIDDDDVNSKYIESLYWAFTTMTTVGYGDMSPKSREGRIFAFFHISAAVSLLGMFIGQVDTAREERRQQLQRQRLMLAKLDEEVWQSILPQGKEHIDKFDFVYGMLTKLELVSESDIHVFSKMFEKYDPESEGKLERVAINDIARAYQRQGSMLAAQRRQTSFITTAKRSSMAFLARSTSVAGVAQSRSDLEPSARAGAVSTSLSSEQLQMSVP